MARIRVIADDGWVVLDELAVPGQLDSDHYRRGLADRIRWAVEDAHADMPAPAREEPVLAAA